MKNKHKKRPAEPIVVFCVYGKYGHQKLNKEVASSSIGMNCKIQFKPSVY